ncbi:MAG: fibronectin type III domain-containing protein [Roseburia sp.]
MKKNRQRIVALLCACVMLTETAGTAYAGEIGTLSATEVVEETTETESAEAETEEEATEFPEQEPDTESTGEPTEVEDTEGNEPAEDEKETESVGETMEVEEPEEEAAEEAAESTEEAAEEAAESTEEAAEEATESTEEAAEEATESTEEVENEPTANSMEFVPVEQGNSGDIAAPVESTEEDWDDPQYLKNLQYEDVASPNSYSSSIVHNSKFANYLKIDGIDVSKWQGSIDWEAVKNSGIDFAIIRLGYRGSGTGTLVTDEYFEKNMKAAKKAGVQIGIYFFTQAITKKEAEEEADYVIKQLAQYDGYVTWPVYIDMENLSGSRLDNANLSSGAKTEICEAFCAKIEKAGYAAGVYSNGWYLKTQMDAEALAANYDIWLANYTNQTSYDGTYNMWQYTSTGTVSGINGNVDMDVAYVPTKPGKPEGLSQTEASTESIALSWNPVMNAEGYKVYYYSSDGTLLDTVMTTTSSVTVEGLKAGKKYPIRVKAYWKEEDGSKTYGSYSAYYDVYTSPGQLKGLNASTQKTTSITLAWDKLSGVAGYQIYQYNESTEKYERIADNVTGTTYEVTGLKAGMSYRFKVRGFVKLNSATKNYGKYSAELFVCTKPDKVTSLEYTDATTASVALKWKKQSGVSGYQVTILDSKGNKLKNCTATKNMLDCTDLKEGTTYRFKVRAYMVEADGSKLYGSYSDEITVKTNPGQVTGLAQSAASGSSVTLKWKKVTGAEKYQIYIYDDSAKKYKKLAETKDCTYQAGNLTAGKKYQFKVRAYNKNGSTVENGKYSAVLKAAVKPDKVKNLKQTSNAVDSIAVSWSKVKNTDGYRVYLYDAKGNLIKKIDTTKTSYTFKSIASGKYTCKVRAYTKTDGYKAWGSFSQVANVNTKPGKMSSVSESACSATSVTLKWKASDGAEGYKIELYDAAKDKYTVLGTTTKCTYKIKNLKTGTGYKIRIRAYLKNGKKTEYGKTTTLNVVTKPQEVSGLKKKTTTADSATMSWKKVKNVDGYILYCYNEKGDLLGSYKTTKTSYKVKNLEKGKYTFKVRAYKATDAYTAKGAMSDSVAVTIK